MIKGFERIEPINLRVEDKIFLKAFAPTKVSHSDRPVNKITYNYVQIKEIHHLNSGRVALTIKDGHLFQEPDIYESVKDSIYDSRFDLNVDFIFADGDYVFYANEETRKRMDIHDIVNRVTQIT